MDNTIELSGRLEELRPVPGRGRLSFNVPKGIVFGLLGPNGAGKTTTIRMIMNITAPDTGEIRVLGAPRAGGRRTGSATCPRSAGSTAR